MKLMSLCIYRVQDHNLCACSSRAKVRRRLAMARTATLNMTSIWKSRGVSTKLKTRLLRATTFAIASLSLSLFSALVDIRSLTTHDVFIFKVRFLAASHMVLGDVSPVDHSIIRVDHSIIRV